MSDETPTLSHLQLFDPYSKLFDRKIRKFPGALPVTLCRDKLPLLRYGYVVATKADGDRVFVVISRNVMMLHRRDGFVRKISLSCTFEHNYLFDAEYVPKCNQLLLFDTLVFANRATIYMSIEQRVELINFFLLKRTPKEEHSMSHFICSKPDVTPIPTSYQWGLTWTQENLAIQAKPIYHFKFTVALWKHIRELPYENDGLIFTRLMCGYRPFSEDIDSIFKWKPEHTIDFKIYYRKSHDDIDVDAIQEEASSKFPSLNIDSFLHPSNQREANHVLFVDHASTKLCVSFCFLPVSENSKFGLCHFDDKIGEFAWDAEDGVWNLVRMRPDKHEPNQLFSTLSCFESITHNIQIQDFA